MKRVGRDATLDEVSVSQAEQRVTEWRRPTTRRARHLVPVTTITVDPRVWETALRLADGVPSRIQIHSSTSVTVHNHPWRIHRRKGIPA